MHRHLLFDAGRKLFHLTWAGLFKRDLLNEFMSLIILSLNSAIWMELAVQMAWDEMGSLIEMVLEINHEKSAHIQEARGKWLITEEHFWSMFE
jgi:hypothetical protein